jgi:hypothetical protein
MVVAFDEGRPDMLHKLHEVRRTALAQLRLFDLVQEIEKLVLFLDG